MDKAAEIEIKIKKGALRNNNDQNTYADKLFKILKPYIAEYRKLECDYGLLPEYYMYHPHHPAMPESQLTLEEAIKVISVHPYVSWLNKQDGFIAAKRKISEQNLTVISQPKIETIRVYRNTFALEFVCALIIHYFTGDTNMLRQGIVTKPKFKPIDTALKRLRFELKKGGGLYYRHESKQHLLQYLLDELLNDDNKNIYSEAKDHENVKRHILTKKIMQALFSIYGIEHISRAAVVDIALNLTAIFYIRPMDRRDARNDANEILRNLIEDEQFRQQTISNILAQIGLEAMTF